MSLRILKLSLLPSDGGRAIWESLVQRSMRSGAMAVESRRSFGHSRDRHRLLSGAAGEVLSRIRRRQRNRAESPPHGRRDAQGVAFVAAVMGDSSARWIDDGAAPSKRGYHKGYPRTVSSAKATCARKSGRTSSCPSRPRQVRFDYHPVNTLPGYDNVTREVPSGEYWLLDMPAPRHYRV